jgi:hypothetical protein
MCNCTDDLHKIVFIAAQAVLRLPCELIGLTQLWQLCTLMFSPVLKWQPHHTRSCSPGNRYWTQERYYLVHTVQPYQSFPSHSYTSNFSRRFEPDAPCVADFLAV